MTTQNIQKKHVHLKFFVKLKVWRLPYLALRGDSPLRLGHHDPQKGGGLAKMGGL
jgi:hypothetical protein